MKTEIYDLLPSNNRKSFYGKAKVIILNGSKFLKSYDTIHCSIDNMGNVHKYSDYKSMATCNHLKSFLGEKYNGYWDKEIEKQPKLIIEL